MQILRNLLQKNKNKAERFLFWLLINNSIIRWTRVPLITTLVPAVTGGYLALREFYGEKWAIFTKLPDVHNTITIGLVSATITIALLKGLADSYLARHEGGYVSFLYNFIVMAANIVNIKGSRFKKAALTIEDSNDTFLAITHPTDQINAILGEAKHFLINSFNMTTEDALRITILEEAGGDAKEWGYIFDTHEAWSQTPAEELMIEGSAAYDCLITGEPRFHPNKELAAARGQYQISDRDRRFGNGSVYCYPITVSTDHHHDKIVLTIITYGNNMLCGGYNDSEITWVSILLKEICRRVELELTLRSIKNWKLTSALSPEASDDQG